MIKTERDNSDLRLRDRGFACFLLDISPHWHALMTWTGNTGTRGINSRSSLACLLVLVENSNFDRFLLVCDVVLLLTIFFIHEEWRDREYETQLRDHA